jgi:adenylate cyclase
VALARQIGTVVDPFEDRGRPRRRLVRIGLPIAGVVLVITSILAIAIYTDRANRTGALALSADLIDTLQHRVAEQVAAYLQPAARATRIARGIAEAPPFANENLQIQERHAAALLRSLPQVALFSLADPQGNYLMVRRGGTPGGIDTKLIRNEPAPRRVTWTRRDAAGRVTGTEADPTDDFDPRTRPWYRDAGAADDLAWTNVYVFFTDRKPGITVSTALRDAQGAVIGVLGLDIGLGTLSEFLAGLHVGHTGKVLIVDRDGRLIAHPDPERMMRSGAEGPTTARLDELDDPVLTRAFDHLRLERTLRRTVEVGGERYILAASPLPSGLVGRDWTVLVSVPESDFAGFVGTNHRTGLAMSGMVVLIASSLAMLLVRQGLRADRAARRLLDREHAIAAQSGAFARLAAQAGLFDPGSDVPRALTEELAAATGARRASLWRLVANGRTLRCEDAFDSETAGHTMGAELHRDDWRRSFAAWPKANRSPPRTRRRSPTPPRCISSG